MHGRTCTSGMACVCVRVVVGQVGRKPMFDKAKVAGHITHTGTARQEASALPR
jgi:hypothetical protein